jgi:hypothetical protein
MFNQLELNAGREPVKFPNETPTIARRLSEQTVPVYRISRRACHDNPVTVKLRAVSYGVTAGCRRLTAGDYSSHSLNGLNQTGHVQR